MSLFEPGVRFTFCGRLGAGDMGIVYRALDRKEHVEVALKTLRDFDAENALYLRREFRVLSRIRHDNLIRLYELFATPGNCFFSMELLDGADIETRLRGHAAPGQLPDAPLAEVADLFLQVAEALAVVHAADRLHRDIKPKNVQVASGGRAVVMDFGLAHVFSAGTVRVATDAYMGTPEYVSPEQGWGAASVGPPTDWYSFGTMLYEVLCGELPFPGNPGRILIRKRGHDAPRVSTRVAGVPAEVDELVAGLLTREPDARSGYAEVVAILGRYARRVHAARPSAFFRVPFVGRRRETDQLQAAFDGVMTQSERAALVYVRGPSGIGKSELLRRFIASAEEGGGAVVLYGRCQPQEIVPFKAVDALIDELSIYLTRREPEQVAALLPPESGALLRLFPVLRCVTAFASFLDAWHPPEPQELRRLGYAGFRALLARLGAEAPLVLHIDDFQWGDVDSVALLAEALRGPDSPRVMVILSHRSEDGDRSPALKAMALHSARGLADITTVIDVGPLGTPELRDLQARLREGPYGATAPDLASLAEQSGGSPLILGELLRWSQEMGGERGARGGRLHIADAILTRVGRLTDAQRDVLEVVAVAGHPLDPHLALRAAGIARGGADVLHALDETLLRRVASGAEDDVLEPLHDRIREVVAASLPEDRREVRHRAIARELRALPDCDPQQLVHHYRKAGEKQEAAHYAHLAAERAEATLAFGLAADLYRLAMELRGGPPDWTVQVRLADALRNAGRCAEAGEWYEQASLVLATTQPDIDEVRALRQTAAEQFLHTGRIERGLRLLQTGLARFDLSMPATPWMGAVLAVWYRARLTLRGYGSTPRAAEQVDAPTRARLDTLWGATTALSMFSHTRADPLGLRHLLLALDVGEPQRVARALRYEAAFHVGLGAMGLGPLLRRVSGLLDAVAALPRGVGTPYDRAWAELCDASVAWFRSDWSGCAVAGRRGEEIFRNECSGAHWEIAVINLFMLNALVYLGEVEEVRTRVREGLRDAERRGDAFSATIYRLGQPASVWLHDDRPEEGSLLAEEAIQRWPSQDFDTQHYHHLLATVQTALYADRPGEAWQRVVDRWPALRRSLLLTFDCVRSELLHLRARAAMAAAFSGAPLPNGSWSRARLRRQAAADARTIRRMRHLPWCAPLSRAIDAALLAGIGERSAAEAMMGTAATEFESLGMRIFVLACRFRAAPSVGGPVVAEQAEAAALAMGVRAPRRLFGMLMPWPE